MQMTSNDLVNYLGVDYDRKGGYLRVTCPFHNDTHPSLLIYPELERGCHCFACGESCSWAWLIHIVKGVSYAEALEALGEPLRASTTFAKPIVNKTPISWCSEPSEAVSKAFTAKHNACSTEWPEEMRAWLEKKKLLKVAKQLDWRWHSASDPKFKVWGDGIVIPYYDNGKVVYERFRAWNRVTRKFEKPKGPVDIGIQPYLSTFRPNDVVMIAEGESDCASLYAHGLSAIGIPGACAKKAINTVLAFINDRSFRNGGYITTICACGDKDEAGRKMNQLIRQAASEICIGMQVIEYTPESADPKADINDDHANGLLKVPIKFTANYGNNYRRQPWANKEFDSYCNRLDSFVDMALNVKKVKDEAEAKLNKYMEDWENNPATKDKSFMEETQFKLLLENFDKWDDEYKKYVKNEKKGCLLLNFEL